MSKATLLIMAALLLAGCTSGPVDRFCDALELGDTATARQYLDQGVNVNARASSGRTPLFIAAGSGQMDMVRLLLAKGARVDPDDRERVSPLQLAVEANYLDIAALLLSKGAKVAPGLLEPVVRDGQVDMARLLLKHGAGVNEKTYNGETALNEAAAAGDAQMVALLLEKGADVHAAGTSGMTPLHDAVQKGDVAVVELLLAKGADPNAAMSGKDQPKDVAGSTPLFLAERPELITLLVDHGADVNAHGMMEYTLLHQAVLDSDLDRAALLLAKGADVNAKGQQKRTPLHLAAEKGDVAMVNLLLDHGADTKIEYQYSAVNNVWSGPNALMDAADNNRIEVVKVLLERGADPNAVEGGGQFGMTAMARARDHNLTAIVDLLKAHGATR